MALDTTTLKSSIKSILQTMITKETNSMDEFAGSLADAIEVFVKSGTVSTDVSTTVATTGTATAQSGTGTGTGTGSIS